MKHIERDLDDSLRPEYRRSDFGEIVKGKHARVDLEVAELVRLLVACIGEDEGVRFTPQSRDGSFAGRQPGDWTYEIKDDQIILSYWSTEFSSISEQVSGPPSVITPEQRTDLHNLLTRQVKSLKAKVAAL